MTKNIDWSKAEPYHTHYIEDEVYAMDSGFHVLRKGSNGEAYYEDLDGRCHYTLNILEGEGYTITPRPATKDHSDWDGVGLPPVGFKFKFTHEFEEGFEYLTGGGDYGWENGDNLEVVYHTVNEEGDVAIILNTQEDVLTCVPITDITLFSPPKTKEEKEIELLEDVATGKYQRFNHEQVIMSCWNVTNDIEDLYKATLDTNISKEEIANVLLGVHQLYEIRFNNLFNQFEQSIKHYSPVEVVRGG